MSKPNKFAALAAQGLDETRKESSAELASPSTERHTLNMLPAEPVRMLGGRVPDSIFREFQYAKLEAESLTGLRRVTTEEAVEALVRLLREEDFKARWTDAVADVRQGRRGR